MQQTVMPYWQRVHHGNHNAQLHQQSLREPVSFRMARISKPQYSLCQLHHSNQMNNNLEARSLHDLRIAAHTCSCDRRPGKASHKSGFTVARISGLVSGCSIFVLLGISQSGFNDPIEMS
jgi:hypothetical protein